LNKLIENDLSLNVLPLIGVDEAGRGALAGPVVIASAILKYDADNEFLNDSKQLSAKRREEVYEWVLEHVEAYSIVEIDNLEIDRINILEATLVGMKQAIDELKHPEVLCLVDGISRPKVINPLQTVVRGDSFHACIAAASILAKVHRDRLMQRFHADYPDYGFCSNKGYGSGKHLQTLASLGPCPIHRFSYAPVRETSIWQMMNES